MKTKGPSKIFKSVSSIFKSVSSKCAKMKNKLSYKMHSTKEKLSPQKVEKVDFRCEDGFWVVDSPSGHVPMNKRPSLSDFLDDSDDESFSTSKSSFSKIIKSKSQEALNVSIKKVDADISEKSFLKSASKENDDEDKLDFSGKTTTPESLSRTTTSSSSEGESYKENLDISTTSFSPLVKSSSDEEYASMKKVDSDVDSDDESDDEELDTSISSSKMMKSKSEEELVKTEKTIISEIISGTSISSSSDKEEDDSDDDEWDVSEKEEISKTQVIEDLSLEPLPIPAILVEEPKKTNYELSNKNLTEVSVSSIEDDTRKIEVYDPKKVLEKNLRCSLSEFNYLKNTYFDNGYYNHDIEYLGKVGKLAPIYEEDQESTINSLYI